MTATIEEIELFEFLDFDHDLSCESFLGCDRTAKKVHVKSCCGKVLALCLKCCAEVHEAQKTKVALSRCGFCWHVSKEVIGGTCEPL